MENNVIIISMPTREESALQIQSAIQTLSNRNLCNKEAIGLIELMLKAYKLIYGEKPRTEEKTVTKEISSYEKSESVDYKEIKKIYTD